MSIETDILDYEYDEQKAEVIFKKPLYAQGWFICLYWVVLIAGIAYWVGIYSPTAFLLLKFAAIFLLLSPYKFFTGVRKLVIMDGVVYVITYNKHSPSKQIHFKNMTAVIEVTEMFFIRKAKYLGGVNLRSMYWSGQWDEMKKVFYAKASYVKGAPKNYAETFLPTSETPLSTGPIGTRGGGSTILKAFPIFYELLLLPYISICNLLFRRK